MTTDISEIVKEADWYESCDARAGLAFYLAENWPAIRESLHRSSEQAGAGWQPIETAPKDGKPILGYSDEGVSYVCWWNNGWCFFQSYKGDRFYFEPTLWTSHPTFPAVGRATPGGEK